MSSHSWSIGLRLIIPGLVIQAVMVGGGYATGRELVEFFISAGPATALAGMGMTAALFSITAIVCFELARSYQGFDYAAFSRIFMGRFWVLFEAGYICILMLSLSVVSAAGALLLVEVTGWSTLPNVLLFMSIVASVLSFGTAGIERIIAVWSVIFYAGYGAMFFLVVSKLGGDIRASIGAEPLDYGSALAGAFSYAGYNIILIPIMIFVARNLRSRSETLIAGALAGPLILLPGLAFLVTLSGFYPDILSEALPVSVVLAFLDRPVLSAAIGLIILGALVKTGVGLLHGFNERVARAAAERKLSMPPVARSGFALAAMFIAAFAASAVGLIDLIKHGYRYSSYYFLAIFLVPVLTRGLWLYLKPEVSRDTIRAICVTLAASSLVLLVPARVTAGEGGHSYDLLVRGGTIYDGSGQTPFVGDVAINGDRIVYVGPAATGDAKQLIDARGMAVAPGFINSMSQSTYSLLHTPGATSDLRQGVTLEVLNEGSSPGPLSAEMKEMLLNRSERAFPFTWDTFGEYMEGLQRTGVAVNFAGWVGAGTVRRYVLGNRDLSPTPQQLDRMTELVRRAIEHHAGSLLVKTAGKKRA